MKRSLVLFPLLLFGSLFAKPHAVPPPQEMSAIVAAEKYDEVLLLTQKVLATVHEVARWKWTNGYPIENKKNEYFLRLALLLKAKELGLDQSWAEHYINSQINAIKILETQDFEQWEQEGRGPFEEVCDLKSELHPYLCELMLQIFDLLPQVYPSVVELLPQPALSVPPLSKRACDSLSGEAWSEAIKPFAPFERDLKSRVPEHQEMSQTRLIKTYDEILLLMQKRLAVMHEVARWKWNHGYPIEDLAQESRVLDKSVEIAMKYGIPKPWAIEFIQAQMDAAKMVQAHDFEIWKREAEGNFDETCDLMTEIRPYLIDLACHLFVKIGMIYPELQKNPQLVQPPLSSRESDRFPPHIWRGAVAPLLNKCIQPKEKA